MQNQRLVDILERFAFEHFQPGIVVPVDSGISFLLLLATGRDFIPAAADEVNNAVNSNKSYQAYAALSKHLVPAFGRPENSRDLLLSLEEEDDCIDNTAMLNQLQGLQAERLALEKEFAARSEELHRRD